MKVYISGYAKQGTKSICYYDFTETKDTKHELLWSSSDGAASYLAVYDDLMFSITESQEYAKVSMFEREKDGYKLLDVIEVSGKGLCHLIYLPMSSVVIGSCYGDGTLFSIAVNEKGFGKVNRPRFYYNLLYILIILYIFNTSLKNWMFGNCSIKCRS